MKNLSFLLIIAILFLSPISVFASDLTIMPIYSTNLGDATSLESGDKYLLIDVSMAKSNSYY